MQRQVRVAVPLSSPQRPLTQLQLSSGCRCFLQGLASSKQKLRRTQGAPLGLFPLHMQPSSAARFPTEGMPPV